MIPVQLTIEGLYSYQERQIIDFKNLTDAGLFGIFGSVGSGKSSILEAISFALYGETERLNMRDKRAYNMMNLKSHTSYIEFDFLNFENKLFRATRDFRRNSKKFDDVKPSSVTFYQQIEGKWIPLEHSNAEQIIGLNYANFKRTIIIPQGQFKEFLELGATERTTMMKEIFNLQRFDLQNNVASLNVKNRSELDQLDGQLKGFEEITEEQISAQKETLKTEQHKFSEAKDNFQKISASFQQLKNLKTDFENLKQKKENFSNLSAQKAEIDILETQTDIYDRVSRIFNPLLAEKDKLSKEISAKRSDAEKQNTTVKKTEAQFHFIKEQLTAIQPKFEALEQSKIQENDLNLIVQILNYSDEIKKLKERTQKGSKEVQEVEEKRKNIQHNIDLLSKEAETLKPKKLDSNLLLQVGNWFIQQKNLKKSQEDQSEKIKKQELQIQQISDELKAFPENFKENFQQKKENLEIQKKEFLQKLDHLKIQQELAKFSSELHNGEACPLCGSSEHPNIVEFHDVHSELKEFEEKVQSVDKELINLQKKENEIDKILERKGIFENQLKAEQEIISDIQHHIENHLKQFIWTEFSYEKEAEFEAKRSSSLEAEKQIEQLNQTIFKERETLAKEIENLEKYQKALETFKIQEAKKEEQINSNRSNLKILNWENYSDKTTEEIENIYHTLSKSNTETEKNYHELVQKEKQISPKLAEEKAILNQLEKQISELKLEILSNTELINASLSQNNFNSFSEIETILHQKINVEERRNWIQKFKIDFETLKNGIHELEEKLKDFSFDHEQFAAKENEFNDAENHLKQINDLVVKLSSEIERLEQEYRKKEDLLKELSQLQKRSENLKVMTNLFKAAGFVQYVSSIYLRQLCDHANIRFHRMTRNQLSLQLNENNDFEIIDYLNEGRSRSVKTLSGGQSFQVSLSLALALAESVQANAQSDKNFFFIDEGFGTQDLESVNIVFETLNALQKENRIVGIISHVEELKEKIPVALEIVKDEERGSLIHIV
ncbi:MULTISPECIES: SbcC/MukB-like Walker B domain-containing protein [unclassified Chryseobacterium]|uniref:AAA family ATPase n=1 Tax=unclassified Chryseobacterium TaxID=2593645 RepID=UPI00226A4CCF|nr:MULTISPECIES: SbcC/MukB-like Walker B domain-containing protein [unclassified Chryseobacterium]